MQTVICMKWGSRYPADYVNRLHSMVQRHTGRVTQVVCFTDDAVGIAPGVVTRPLPQINIPERVAWTPWRKLSLWCADLDIPTSNANPADILFFDLDMVITGSIDPFFDYEPGRYCVIHNWTQPKLAVGNTSLFRIPVGRFAHVFDRFDADPEAVLSSHRIEQQYISATVDDQVFWPRDWCLSFKHDLIPRWPLNFLNTPQLPPSARAVAFTGKPDPDEAALGHWPVEKPWKRLYKHVRPTPWITENWR